MPHELVFRRDSAAALIRVTADDGRLAPAGRAALESRHDDARRCCTCACDRSRAPRRRSTSRSARPPHLDESRLAQHDLVREPLPDDVFDRYSGFLIGGSPFNVTDPESTKTVVQRRLERDLERIAERAVDAPDRGAVHLLRHRRRHPPPRRRGEPRLPRRHRARSGRTHRATAGPTRSSAGSPRRFTALTAHKEGVGRRPAGRRAARDERRMPRPGVPRRRPALRDPVPPRADDPRLHPSAWPSIATTATSRRASTT